MNAIRQFFHNIRMQRKIRSMAYANPYTTTSSDGTLNAIAAKRKLLIEQQEQQGALVKENLERSAEQKQFLDPSSASVIEKLKSHAIDRAAVIEESIPQQVEVAEKPPSFLHDFIMTVGMDLAGAHQTVAKRREQSRKRALEEAAKQEKIQAFNELAMGRQ